jgi:hypothetical protein
MFSSRLRVGGEDELDNLEPAGVELAISVTVRASGVRPYSAAHMAVD